MRSLPGMWDEPVSPLTTGWSQKSEMVCVWLVCGGIFPDTPLLSYFLPHRWSLRSSVIRTFILIDVRFFHLVFKESLSEQWSRHGGWLFFWMEVCLGIYNEGQMSKVHPEDSIWSENKSWLRVANIQLSVSMFPSWCPWNQSIRFVRSWHLSLRRDLMWITELGLISKAPTAITAQPPASGKQALIMGAASRGCTQWGLWEVWVSVWCTAWSQDGSRVILGGWGHEVPHISRDFVGRELGCRGCPVPPRQCITCAWGSSVGDDRKKFTCVSANFLFFFSFPASTVWNWHKNAVKDKIKSQL